MTVEFESQRVYSTLSHPVDGYVERGMNFSINLLWGEVAVQTAGAQDAVQTAAAVQSRHTLLEMAEKETTEREYLTLEPALELMLTITAVDAPSDSGSRSSWSVSYRSAGPPTGSRGCRTVGATMTTRLQWNPNIQKSTYIKRYLKNVNVVRR